MHCNDLEKKMMRRYISLSLSFNIVRDHWSTKVPKYSLNRSISHKVYQWATKFLLKFSDIACWNIKYTSFTICSRVDLVFDGVWSVCSFEEKSSSPIWNLNGFNKNVAQAPTHLIFVKTVRVQKRCLVNI